MSSRLQRDFAKVLQGLEHCAIAYLSWNTWILSTVRVLWVDDSQ